MMFRAPLSYVVAAVNAFLAALHKILYASVLVNDDFMHRAYALQLLSGDWPIRDFFDYGMVLMYLASAVAQMLFGYRLLAEAVLIGLTVGLTSFLVFEVVRRLTESNAAAPTARAPTARMAPLRVLIATTDGSFRTTPRPRTYTSVFAVPRSTAISRPRNPNTPSVPCCRGVGEEAF